jgi:hypothetical protein
MAFLNKKPATQLTLTLPLTAEEAQKARPHIETILSNLSVDEFALFAKVCGNSLYKANAVSELKKHFS